ncbi:Scr1 family TA system antitoxin-like transcriptional regulator [Streptomyces antibioticus]|uniref:Scr1 family TA system antitoxin-like transcriptional regulator n=1 Tax=Streptomyces antibioticus TaxID=1890 RepID=UPI0037A9EFAF
MPLEQAEIERLVGIRLWAILDASVILRGVGSAEVMREQLDRLLEANESPHITLQVLPFAKGAHTAALGSFVITGGTEPSLDVVYADFHTGSLFLEKGEELERYRLDMEATSAMIRCARKEL